MLDCRILAFYARNSQFRKVCESLVLYLRVMKVKLFNNICKAALSPFDAYNYAPGHIYLTHQQHTTVIPTVKGNKFRSSALKKTLAAEKSQKPNHTTCNSREYHHQNILLLYYCIKYVSQNTLNNKQTFGKLENNSNRVKVPHLGQLYL